MQLVICKLNSDMVSYVRYLHLRICHLHISIGLWWFDKPLVSQIRPFFRWHVIAFYSEVGENKTQPMADILSQARPFKGWEEAEKVNKSSIQISF